MLSHHEQRCLAAIEHELEHDPTLTRLAERLARSDPSRRRRPAHWVAWWIAVVLEIGALSWVAVGVTMRSQAIVMVSLLFAVLLGVPLAGVATARLLDRHRV